MVLKSKLSFLLASPTGNCLRKVQKNKLITLGYCFLATPPDVTVNIAAYCNNCVKESHNYVCLV